MRLPLAGLHALFHGGSALMCVCGGGMLPLPSFGDVPRLPPSTCACGVIAVGNGGPHSLPPPPSAGNFNSDNCLVGGRTMDYGPFGFIERYEHDWNSEPPPPLHPPLAGPRRPQRGRPLPASPFPLRSPKRGPVATRRTPTLNQRGCRPIPPSSVPRRPVATLSSPSSHPPLPHLTPPRHPPPPRRAAVWVRGGDHFAFGNQACKSLSSPSLAPPCCKATKALRMVS